MARFGLWKFTEGVGLSVADSDNGPVNLTITATAGSGWSTARGAGWHNTGNPGCTILSPAVGAGSKIAIGLAGSRRAAWSFTYATASAATTCIVGLADATDTSIFEVYSGSIWFANQQLFSTVTLPNDGAYHHAVVRVDSTRATNRGEVWVDGVLTAQGNGSLTQNRAIDAATALANAKVCITCGGDGAARITGDVYSAALYDWLEIPQITRHAGLWRANNDVDPDADANLFYGGGF